MKIPPNTIKIPIRTISTWDVDLGIENCKSQEYDTFQLDFFETLDCLWRFEHYEEYLVDKNTFVIEYNEPRLQRITRNVYKKQN